MSNQIETSNTRNIGATSEQTEEFVTFTIAGQLFGIPVLQIQDVLPRFAAPVGRFRQHEHRGRERGRAV